jgi:hypothetical protein
MKKKLLIILFFAFFSSMINAQVITNGSFENWTAGEPDGWYTSNGLYAGSVTEVSNAHAGYHAVSMNAVLSGGSYQVYTLTLASMDVSSPPTALHGWYIFNSVNSEYLVVSVNILNGSNSSNYGIGQAVISASQSVYKEFVATINYVGGTNAQTAGVGFSMYALDNSADHSGTYAIIDDLSWDGTSGIDNIINGNSLNLEEASPNPAYDRTEIKYSVPSTAKVNLTIYDITGRIVKVLVNEIQTAGRYKAILNASDLQAGQYIYQLDISGQKLTKKLAVIK